MTGASWEQVSGWLRPAGDSRKKPLKIYNVCTDCFGTTYEGITNKKCKTCNGTGLIKQR